MFIIQNLSYNIACLCQLKLQLHTELPVVDFIYLFSYSTRMQSLQVDSVQRWMEDLRHMTEVECMCVLQAKPIGVDDDTQHGELIVAAGVGAGDHVARNNLQTLLRRALVVSTELGKMFQRLEKGRWQRVHSTAVRANCHVRSLVHEYSSARSTPPEMQKVSVDFGRSWDVETNWC